MMARTWSTRFFVLLGAVLCGFASASVRAAPSYHYTGLGNFGTDQKGMGLSEAAVINGAGQVVGYSDVYDKSGNNRGPAGFLYSGGTLINLGYLGTGSNGRGESNAYDINAAGQVAFSSVVFDASGTRLGAAAFLYSGGHFTNLGNFGSNAAGRDYFSNAMAINDAGQIAGDSAVFDGLGRSLGQAAFLYSTGTPLTNLGNFGTNANGVGLSTAKNINASGQVVGYSEVYDGSGTARGDAAFLYSGGTLTNLGNFGTDAQDRGKSYAFDINASGQVVGSSEVYDGSGMARGDAAFLYSGGRLINLGNFGTDASGNGYSTAVAINASGQVVGSSSVYDGSGTSLGRAALLYSGDTLIDLGNLGTDLSGAGQSEASAINASGQVVGFSKVYDELGVDLGTAAFLYDDGVLYNLNDLLDVSLPIGWTLVSAGDINDAGQIIGEARYSVTGEKVAFLLDPVPEPATLALAGLGLACLGVARRGRGSPA